MLWILWLAACVEPCTYKARCDGTVLETCFIHADQLLGSGESKRDCATAGNVCVETQPDVAFCALGTTVSCSPGESYCTGDHLVTCNTHGYPVAESCREFGPTCVQADVPTCGIAPVKRCDFNTFVPRCQGGDLILCSGDVERRADCKQTCGPDPETQRKRCF